MGFVDNDKIPVGLTQSRKDVITFGEVEGGDDLLLLHPLVDTELVTQVAALDHQEFLVELLQ